MADDDYLDNEDDIHDLEDHFLEEEEIFPGEGPLSEGSSLSGEALPPDVPIFRIRLPYSNETFLAAWPGEEPLHCKTWVIADTRHGKDLAQVIGPLQRRGAGPDTALIIRPAETADLEKAERNRSLEIEAFDICKEKIESRRLEMKLIAVHYVFDESNILFLFAAENRVDFRELIKDLVSIFKTRIELRQIGVRDEARVVGGLGVCGRAYCCHAVSDKLKPVSIKMAKDQNLALNSMKISGACGRLLCCLAYEHGFYNEQRKLIPSEGARFTYEETAWRVTEVNVAAGTVNIAAADGRQLRLPASQFEKTDGRWGIKKKAPT